MFLKTRKPDLTDVIFFIVLAAGALFLALNYHITGNFRLSPSLFPVTASLVLIGLSLVLAIKSCQPSPENTEAGPRTSTRNAAVVFLLCLIYTYVMGQIGFIPSTAAYLLVFLLLLGERRPVVIISVPVLTVGAVWLFFSKALAVPLP